MTDNGAVFTSDEFEGFLKTNGVTHTHTALYHPASNRLAKRAVRKMCFHYNDESNLTEEIGFLEVL